MARRPRFAECVFINCPFDREYWPIFEAIVCDISRIEVSRESSLPRFNMPFEFGLDFGAKHFGSRQQKRKRLLVLDAKPYRYRASLSDIAGQDIHVHNDSPDDVIKVVRHWLRTASRRQSIPTVTTIWKRFLAFGETLPQLCDENRIERADMQFIEYVTLAGSWLTASTT